MSSIVFAGSAQFIGAQLISVSTPGIVVVLTTFVVNLRHALYSLSLAERDKRRAAAQAALERINAEYQLGAPSKDAVEQGY